MSKRKLPYHEGDWCSIPLGNGGYALALLARSNGKGHLFCYFFGPRQTKPPKYDDSVIKLKPSDAHFHALCTDVGLINRHWRFIGRPQVWDRFDWPIPPLLEQSPNGSVQATQFEDTLSTLTRKPLKLSDAELDTLQGSSLLNASAVEGFLNKTLPKTIARIFPIV